MARQVFNNIWASAGAVTDPGSTKTNLGWVVEAPTHQNFNFIQNKTDEMLQHIERSGVPVYDPATIYEVGGYCRDGNNMYRSLSVSNVGNAPSTSPTKWVLAFMLPTNNLSDLANKTTARTNLDVYSKAQTDAYSYSRADSNSRYYLKGDVDSNFLGISNQAADSAKLVGVAGANFARRDTDNMFTGYFGLNNGTDTAPSLQFYNNPRGDFGVIRYTNGVFRIWQSYNGGAEAGCFSIAASNRRATFDVDPYVNTDKIWHAGNDGSGSGLDADLIDGLNSTAFIRSNLNSNQLVTGSPYLREVLYTQTSGVVWNLISTPEANTTLTANRAVTITGGVPAAGTYCTIRVIQNATGNRTLSWSSDFDFGDAGIPDLTVDGNAQDIISFRSNGTKMQFIGIAQGF